MLENLSEKVRFCMEKAEACAHRAKTERDPSLVRDFLDMERRWLKLARSYQFSEQLEKFYKFNQGRLEEAGSFLSTLKPDSDDKPTSADQNAQPESSGAIASDHPGGK